MPLTSYPDGNPIRVALVIGQLELGGGAEQQLAALACGLPEHGFLPLVVNLRGGRGDGRYRTENYWADYLRDRGVFVMEIPRAFNKDLRRLVPLARFLRRERPAILHSFMFPANAYARIAALVAFPRRRPILLTSELSGALPSHPLERFVDRCLEPITDGIMANAHAIRRMLEARRSRVPVWVVHNGLDLARFAPGRRREARARLGLSDGAPVVGIVARMSAEKNYPFFIDLVSRVTRHLPGLRALAIGDGPLRLEIESAVERLGLREVLRLVGRVDNVSDFLPALDVFLLVSEYEGLSNAVMEAQATGLPCVVSDVGGNAEIVEEGGTGFLAAPHDLSRFTDRVVTLLSDPGLRDTMGRAARSRMEERFSMETMISSTVAMYRELLQSRAGARPASR